MEEILTLLSYFPTPIPREDDSKGLENGAGDNNCFVNVVIQSLWHLDSFRQKFNIMKREHRHVDPCAFCALEIIFTQYEFSDEAVIPPTALRQTMALLFKNSARFQMFELGDAAELFEALMGCLHDAFIGDCNNGLPKEKHSSLNHHGIECKDVNCVAHRVFGLNVTEKLKCKSCGIVSEPTTSNMFVVYSYATELRNAYLQSPSSSFCRLLQLAGEDHRLCPNKEKCSNICMMTHSLKSIPDVFSAGIVWGPEPTVEEIDTVLRMLSLRIDLSNVFEVEDPKPCWYRFRGMICYYGKHYVAYFFNIKVRQWYVFDDTAVRAVGSDWATVRDRCLRGRLQPSVVFYEREDLDPIPQESYIAAQSSMPPPQSAMDAKELSSYVKISKIVHTDIEKEIKQSLREEGIYVPEESFIFVPSAHDDEEEVDILCVRTNWLYRRQSRRYRFKATNFMRVIPGTAEIKDTFEYKDVFDITVTDKTNIIIRFYSGKEPQYIQSDRVEEIIALVTKRASRLNHTFPVKRV